MTCQALASAIWFQRHPYAHSSIQYYPFAVLANIYTGLQAGRGTLDLARQVLVLEDSVKEGAVTWNKHALAILEKKKFASLRKEMDRVSRNRISVPSNCLSSCWAQCEARFLTAILLDCWALLHTWSQFASPAALGTHFLHLRVLWQFCFLQKIGTLHLWAIHVR